MLQGRKLYPLDEIHTILDDVKAKYEANNQKLSTGIEIKEKPDE
jgi:hypothetical protein